MGIQINDKEFRLYMIGITPFNKRIIYSLWDGLIIYKRDQLMHIKKNCDLIQADWIKRYKGQAGMDIGGAQGGPGPLGSQKEKKKKYIYIYIFFFFSYYVISNL